MRILYIGGTGRLSKDVAWYTLYRGEEVYLITRGSEHRSLFVEQDYNMIYCDIRDSVECIKKLKDYEFDVVIDFLSYNVEQLENTLNIIKGKYKQYIFISSATVYKKKVNEIISESHTEVGNDLWIYAINKYKCEQYIEQYFNNREGVKYTIVRPYITYGNTRVPYPIVPQKNWQEWTLVERIVNGQPIPIFDEGKTITTLTHTRDFAIGMYGLMMNEKAYGESVHITSDDTTTWKEVLICIGNKLNCDVKFANIKQEEIYYHIPYYREILIGDKGTNMRFDNSKIRELVPQFNNFISLQSGINEMIDFYVSHPQIQKICMGWNGQIDRLCEKVGYKIDYPYKFRTAMEEEEYWSGRNGT